MSYSTTNFIRIGPNNLGEVAVCILVLERIDVASIEIADLTVPVYTLYNHIYDVKNSKYIFHYLRDLPIFN